jgi:hypothetical protein
VKHERGRSFNIYLRPEAKQLLDRLCAEYHLSMGAVVTTAIVDMYKSRLGPQPVERKKRNGNGHT